ncbi:hypothetical protein HI914_06640 [Erysiphe necator]|nr:hypothetical protein HI914_06640 [Erysiphe necator]
MSLRSASTLFRKNLSLKIATLLRLSSVGGSISLLLNPVELAAKLLQLDLFSLRISFFSSCRISFALVTSWSSLVASACRRALRASATSSVALADQAGLAKGLG